MISIGTDVFPGFFVPRSNFKPQFSVKNAAEAAKILGMSANCGHIEG